MKFLTNFLLYIIVGAALYVLGICFKKRCPIVFQLYFIAAPASTLAMYVVTILGSLHGKPVGWVREILVAIRWVDWASLVLLGYGLAYLVGERARSDSDYAAGVVFLIRGLSIQLALTFIYSAYEEFSDIDGIRKFFLTSGYTSWFMYLILYIQLLVGMLLLFNLRFYTKLSAVGLLLAVMVGAFITHLVRGDRFNIAIPALELALKCLILLLVYVLSLGIRCKRPSL